MTFNEAALERMLNFLRNSGHWNIAEAFRDAIEMATSLQVQSRAGRSLTRDELAFIELMQKFPDRVADYFGDK